MPSTINRQTPLTGQAVMAAPISGNFNAAANDIEALQTSVGSINTSLPTFVTAATFNPAIADLQNQINAITSGEGSDVTWGALPAWIQSNAVTSINGQQGVVNLTIPQGTVTSVNGVSPVGGNVTLTIPAGTVTSIMAGAGLSGGTITGSGTISLPNVGPGGTHANPSSISLDAQGRITAITAGGGGAGFNGHITNPINIEMTTTPQMFLDRHTGAGAVGASQNLGSFDMRGWNGSAFASGFRIEAITSQAWTTGVNGTIVNFNLTQTGEPASNATRVMQFAANGGVVFGAGTTASLGPGVIRVAQIAGGGGPGIYVGNQSIQDWMDDRYQHR